MAWLTRRVNPIYYLLPVTTITGNKKATDEGFRTQMVAMLSDPGQLEEIRKRLLLTGEGVPVDCGFNPLESKFFKKLDPFKGNAGSSYIFAQLAAYSKNKYSKNRLI